jgi:uncharacterized damage-inducible protein DinB
MESILQRQCDYVGAQVRAAVREMRAGTWDARLAEGGMTVRETMIHLCDVYRYVSEKARGGEPRWGTYRGDGSLDDFDKLRSVAIEACLASEDPYELLTDYIIAHDAYHVGQLCFIRRAREPDWDAYAVYGT